MTPIPVEDWSGNIAPSEFALKKRGLPSTVHLGWDWTNELLDEILVVTLRLYPFCELGLVDQLLVENSNNFVSAK